MEIITLDTTVREQFVDITAQVRTIVEHKGVQDGMCLLWCRHTTAALTVNENTDPDVQSDIIMALGRIISSDWPYTHSEGNSTAHLKSSLIGCSLSLPIRGGELSMGVWQGVYFCEFDGPRKGRQVSVSVIPMR
jgi:secondary thiamine-phosphate synthase enzyme